MPAARSDFNPPPHGIPTGRAGTPALSATQALSLHARLVARDERALAELIEVITPWLLGMAQALLSDPDEAEEVVQEAFTIIWTRIGQVPEEPRGLLAWALPNEAGTPGWHVHQTVHAALEALPREQQVVVWLAYFQGLTQTQIADRLGIPIGTVKTRLRLAFDKLRLVLAPLKDWIV